MVPEGAYLQNLVVQVVLSFKDTNDSSNWQNVIGTTTELQDLVRSKSPFIASRVLQRKPWTSTLVPEVFPLERFSRRKISRETSGTNAMNQMKLPEKEQETPAGAFVQNKLERTFNPFTAKFSQKQISTKCLNWKTNSTENRQRAFIWMVTP